MLRIYTLHIEFKLKLKFKLKLSFQETRVKTWQEVERRDLFGIKKIKKLATSATTANC